MTKPRLNCHHCAITVPPDPCAEWNKIATITSIIVGNFETRTVSLREALGTCCTFSKEKKSTRYNMQFKTPTQCHSRVIINKTKQGCKVCTPKKNTYIRVFLQLCTWRPTMDAVTMRDKRNLNSFFPNRKLFKHVLAREIKHNLAHFPRHFFMRFNF